MSKDKTKKPVDDLKTAVQKAKENSLYQKDESCVGTSIGQDSGEDDGVSNLPFPTPTQNPESEPEPTPVSLLEVYHELILPSFAILLDSQAAILLHVSGKVDEVVKEENKEKWEEAQIHMVQGLHFFLMRVRNYLATGQIPKPPKVAPGPPTQPQPEEADESTDRGS